MPARTETIENNAESAAEPAAGSKPPSPSSPPAPRAWGSAVAAVVAILTLLGIAWMEKLAWNKLAIAEDTLQRAHAASLSTGVQIEESLARMKLALLTFLVSDDDESRATFNAETRQISSFIAESRATLNSPAINDLITELESRFKGFLTDVESMAPLRTIRKGAVETLAADLKQKTASLFETTASLIKQQDQYRATLKAESAAAFQSARNALRASLVALVILLGSFALLVRQSLLLPLRNRLHAAAAETSRHEKLASIGVLATGVAHEIRNPLTAIKFRLFSLKKSLGSDLGDNEDFQTIRSEIDRLERLVKSFLEFARPADPQITPVSAADLFGEVQRLLAPEMSRKQISFRVDADAAPAFHADRQQIGQVLINLAQNAADSMPGGGSITLRARSGMASLDGTKREAVLLDVIDTGTGIDPEVQKRLFDPFFSTREGGTGLGLAIASRIVEQHRGSLQFSTRAGEGSTFTVVLPKEPAHG